jgi:NADPH-dependent curcumin reductase CurA
MPSAISSALGKAATRIWRR